MQIHIRMIIFRWSTCVILLVLVGCRANDPTAQPAAPEVSTPIAINPPAQSESAPTISTGSTPDSDNAPDPTATAPATETEVIEVEGAILPPDFSLIKYADFYRPTSLAFDDAGRLLATSFDGTVHVLVDEDGDGRADTDSIFAQGFNIPLGIEFNSNTGDVLVSSNGRIDILRDGNDDLVADEVVVFVHGLPGSGLHQNDNLKFGPDGALYVGIGSACDACDDDDERSATIMRFDIETAEGQIYASGLRNPYDIAFHPETGALFATDNGRDDLGDDAPLEELNHIVEGGDYGYPDCWDRALVFACEDTIPAVAFFPAHSSTNSIDFYDGDSFPEEYRNNLFAATWGSFIVEVERGIKRIELTPAGDTYASEQEWFVQWPDGWLLGLIVGPDGALYVGDYINGGIYRISYGLP